MFRFFGIVIARSLNDYTKITFDSAVLLHLIYLSLAARRAYSTFSAKGKKLNSELEATASLFLGRGNEGRVQLSLKVGHGLSSATSRPVACTNRRGSRS